MLVGHVGGAPSAVERALIARAARLALYVELMDERSLPTGQMSERDARQRLAWENTLRRTLVALGLKGAAPKAPSLADYLASKKAAEAAP